MGGVIARDCWTVGEAIRHETSAPRARRALGRAETGYERESLARAMRPQAE